MGFLSKLFGYEAKKPVSTGGPYGRREPIEENQYNFKGTYVQYFEKVYTEEFPEYRIEHVEEAGLRSSVFTFWKDGQKALVVELLSETSTSYKLRQECAASNISYLRFYYNHAGWWNTRYYVVSRTKDALK